MFWNTKHSVHLLLTLKYPSSSAEKQKQQRLTCPFQLSVAEFRFQKLPIPCSSYTEPFFSFRAQTNKAERSAGSPWYLRQDFWW